MALYHVIMADIINSSSYDSEWLSEKFIQIVHDCNESCAAEILSPLTITLGDEFQGVAASLKGAVDTIFYLEERLLADKYPFRLRYVVCFGDIGTEINPTVAYGMMGRGLATARQQLIKKQRVRPRFFFDLGDDAASRATNRLFRLVELLTNRWKRKDCNLVKELLASENNSDVAAKLDKDRSLIWKRRKSLHIEEYMILKNLVYDSVALFKEGR
jgi:SatD family (SatD)